MVLAGDLVPAGTTLMTPDLGRSSRFHPNWTGSNARGSELRAVFQLAVLMCARFAFSSNASLEGGNDLSSGAFVALFLPGMWKRLFHQPLPLPVRLSLPLSPTKNEKTTVDLSRL